VYNWTKISFTLYKLSNCLLHGVGHASWVHTNVLHSQFHVQRDCLFVVTELD
jgi:hypothetical protein